MLSIWHCFTPFTACQSYRLISALFKLLFGYITISCVPIFLEWRSLGLLANCCVRLWVVAGVLAWDVSWPIQNGSSTLGVNAEPYIVVLLLGDSGYKTNVLNVIAVLAREDCWMWGVERKRRLTPRITKCCACLHRGKSNSNSKPFPRRETARIGRCISMYMHEHTGIIAGRAEAYNMVCHAVSLPQTCFWHCQKHQHGSWWRLGYVASSLTT